MLAPWLVSGICGATLHGLGSLHRKQILNTSDVLLHSFYSFLFGFLFLLATNLILHFFFAFPVFVSLNSRIGLAGIVGSGMANTGSIFLVNCALWRTDASIVYPLRKTSVIPVTILAYLLLRESLTIVGLFGIAIVTVGAYQAVIGSGNWLKPVLALKSNVGARFALVASLAGGAAAFFDRLGSPHVNTFFYTTSVYGVISLAFAVILLARTLIWRRPFFPDRLWPHAVVGGTFASGSLLVFYAVSVQKAAYVATAQQVQILVVFAGSWLLFREQIQTRILGALAIVAGVLLLTTV